MSRISVVTLAMIGCLFWTTLPRNAHATAILSPVEVLGTDLGVSRTDTPLVNMINQSGLDKPFTSGVTNFDAYFNEGDPAWGHANYLNNWNSNFSFNLPLMGYVDFDLGDIYRIDRVAIWNLSLKDLSIVLSEELGGPTQTIDGISLETKLYHPNAYEVQIVDLGGQYPARYMRFAIESVHLYSPSDPFGYAIVGEVAVSAAPVNGGFVLGDMDNNGVLDAFDVAPFELALADASAYMAAFPGLDPDILGDFDASGALDAFDVTGFEAALAGVGTSVPQPATIGLLLAGLGAMFGRSGSQRK